MPRPPQIPEGFEPYKRTRTFDQTSVPKGLLSRHSTKPGIWGLIHIEQGELEYRVHGPQPRVQRLEPGVLGVVVPEVEHQVRSLGPVSFYVEFWRLETVE